MRTAQPRFFTGVARSTMVALALGATVASAPLLQAQATTQGALKIEGSKKLQTQAKITADSAARIAAAQVPGTTASQAKIEREAKHLAWAVSLVKPNTKDVDRVWVDATTGAVVKTKHYGGLSGRVRRGHQEHEMKEAKKEKS